MLSGGGGQVLHYMDYYVRLQRPWSFSHFGHKWDREKIIDFGPEQRINRVGIIVSSVANTKTNRHPGQNSCRFIRPRPRSSIFWKLLDITNTSSNNGLLLELGKTDIAGNMTEVRNSSQHQYNLRAVTQKIYTNDEVILIGGFFDKVVA